MSRSLEVTFAPAEFAAFPDRDLGRTVCVVFDVLRATSSMVTALGHGAAGIIPVTDIPEALARRQAQPGILLAGERHGVRIRAADTGGIDFDLGNSPREFTVARVHGRLIVMTTTNGTRALRACAGAAQVLAGSFLNLGALANWIERHRPPNLLLVGSGTVEQAAFEDALGAGALADAIWPLYADGEVSDAAQLARHTYRNFARDLPTAFRLARNGRRLLAIPELRDDVAVCATRDTFDVVPILGTDGVVRTSPRAAPPREG
jgi:2-phosphosulfolactate phosphatase